MANSQLNGERYEYASIDTAPGAAGYWCKPVSVAKKSNGVFFSRSGGGDATVHIQFKLAGGGDTWTDYLTTEDLSDGARLRFADAAGDVHWRAGVKNGNYTSGTVIVGFDW